MKLGGRAGNPVEMILAALDLVPQPLLDTHVAMLLARAVMEGARLGVFIALQDGAATGGEVAARCSTHPAATGKLLDALVGAGYLHRRGERYSLARRARRWLLPGSAFSLHDKMLWQLTEWEWIGQLGGFVRSGSPLRFHDGMSAEGWRDYQRAMRDVAAISAPEVARRTPIPKGARRMLDLGGSHGLYAASLCRRYPQLSAVILDLPVAIEHAAPLLAREGMRERVVHRAGDVLTEDLGEGEWDVVFASSLVHHFDEASNRELARRAARALRPGGVLILQELVRPRSPRQAGQIGALLGLYFALTSRSGTWSFEEMAAWQREAGLVPRRPIRFVTGPGSGQQVGVKPAR
jgi:SAM-dependent methyltransferase